MSALPTPSPRTYAEAGGKRFWRIPQYPIGDERQRDKTRAVCIGVVRPGEDVENTLRALYDFERRTSRGNTRAIDPRDFIFVSASAP